MTSRDRTRRWRSRQRSSRRVYPIEADEVDLQEVLLAGGFLDPLVADQFDQQLAALQRLIEALRLKL